MSAFSLVTSQHPAAAGRASAGPATLQRRCACEGAAGRPGTCEDCATPAGGKLQRRGNGAAGAAIAPPIVHDVLRSSGHQLDMASRAFFEPRFRHDFGKIRIHADPLAQKSAESVGALAYTVGRHIVFGEGQFAPQSRSGRRLLAHELVHTLQQDGAADSASQPVRVEPQGSSAEREADRLADSVLGLSNSDVPMPGVSASSRTLSPRLSRAPKRGSAAGCGVCLGGDPRVAGTIAHFEIQEAFRAFNPDLSTEYPVPTVPGDETPPFAPRLDLAIEEFAFGQHVIHIGEIKPLDDAGQEAGIARRILGDYARELLFTFDEVFRLTKPPLPIPIPFINPANPAGCPPQLLTVQLTEPGIYQYFCDPPWSELVTDPQCSCGQKPRQKEEEDEREEKKDEKDEEEDDEKTKDEEDEKDKTKDDDNDQEHPFPVPRPEVLVPIAAAALLAAAAGLVAKFGAKRVLGPAAIIAAIILLQSGAEASVGGDGDDALEAMFNLAAQKGAAVPDDLKDAIRNDPELKKVLADAARSGDFGDAKRQLGEKLTRTIVANRDQFTDQEIEELLQVTQTGKDVIPGADVSIAELRKALDASHRRGNAGASGDAGGASGPAKVPETATPPLTPSTRVAELDAASPEVKRLVATLIGHMAGPALTADAIRQMVAAAKSLTPPLSAGEVDELIKTIGPAEGKTIDEVLDSVRRGIASLRAGTPQSAGAPGQTAHAQAAQPSPVETTDKPPGQPTATGLAFAEALKKNKAQYDVLAPGAAALAYGKTTILQAGKSFDGYLIARSETGVLLLGPVVVTPKSKTSATEWVVTIAGGAQVYDEAGRPAAKTRTADMKLFL